MIFQKFKILENLILICLYLIIYAIDIYVVLLELHIDHKINMKFFICRDLMEVYENLAFYNYEKNLGFMCNLYWVNK